MSQLVSTWKLMMLFSLHQEHLRLMYRGVLQFLCRSKYHPDFTGFRRSKVHEETWHRYLYRKQKIVDSPYQLHQRHEELTLCQLPRNSIIFQASLRSPSSSFLTIVHESTSTYSLIFLSKIFGNLDEHFKEEICLRGKVCFVFIHTNKYALIVRRWNIWSIIYLPKKISFCFVALLW